MTIRSKLYISILGLVALSLLLISIAVALNNKAVFFKTLQHNTQMMAKIIGDNSQAALSFGDKRAANEVLSSLRANTSLLYAVLYDSQGGVFSTFNPSYSPIRNVTGLNVNGYILSEGKLLVWETIRTPGYELTGKVLLAFATKDWDSILKRFLQFILFLSLSIFLLIFLIANQLSKIITTPLIELGETTKKVSHHKDYSIRAKKMSNDEAGQLVGTFNTMLEEIQNRDGQLSFINQSLEKEIEERKQIELQLQEARNAADSANKAKTQFLAAMSHELRTPLNAIIGFSEQLKDEMLGALTKDQKEYCGDIFVSGQHLLDLINELLDLSKIEAGKMELNLESTYMPELITQVVFLLREKAFKNNIQVDIDISEKVKEFLVDAKKIKQVLFNLLSNALKFTPSDGKVSVKADITEDRHLEIQVVDTGVGMSEEDLKELFKPFNRLKDTAQKVEGTGLGLVMIKKIAELHGGTVDVKSNKGEGSTFTVYIPQKST